MEFKRIAFNNVVYVALGGNVGDTLAIFEQALKVIGFLGVKSLVVSPIYMTTPVSQVPQPHYLNAVCRFETQWGAHELLEKLQQIEKSLGKKKEFKDAPRTIDLDILFYGTEEICDEQLTIPHPRWQERLFVLVPLSDLTSTVQVKDKTFHLPTMLREFPNSNEETILLKTNKCQF